MSTERSAYLALFGMILIGFAAIVSRSGEYVVASNILIAAALFVIAAVLDDRLFKGK